MPALSSDETYQLWGIINGTPISIGLMGDLPNEVGFTVAGGATPSSLDVTVEPAGGTQTPTSPVVASGVV
jgi:anti-sigma-K factor RskA